jgi:hypothetical protein
MGSTGRPNMIHYAIQSWRLRMTGTKQHAPRGTAGRGPNWDHGPRAGHARAARRYTKRHRRLWAQPVPWAVHGPRELRVDACTSRHRRPRDPLGTAGRKRAGRAARLGADLRVYACARGQWAASGPEELRDSKRSDGCRHGAVTVCFQYLVQQVTVSDDSTFYSELALLHSELGVASRISPFNCGPEY